MSLVTAPVSVEHLPLTLSRVYFCILFFSFFCILFSRVSHFFASISAFPVRGTSPSIPVFCPAVFPALSAIPHPGPVRRAHLSPGILTVSSARLRPVPGYTRLRQKWPPIRKTIEPSWILSSFCMPITKLFSELL